MHKFRKFKTNRQRFKQELSEWDKLQHSAFVYAKSLGLPCEKLTKHYKKVDRRRDAADRSNGVLNDTVAHDPIPDDFNKEILKPL